MKRPIPVAYAISGLASLGMSVVFEFTFRRGLRGAGYLIWPWTNLMLLTASVGMALTVAAAILERRKPPHGPENAVEARNEGDHGTRGINGTQ